MLETASVFKHRFILPRNRVEYAVTGIYMDDASVFNKIRALVPSRHSELQTL